MQIFNWILKQQQLNPQKIAVSDGTTQLTFAKLADLTNRYAATLSQITSAQMVGMLATNTLSAYLLALAVIGSGKTIVWFNWRLDDEQLKKQVADSGVAVCLYPKTLQRQWFLADDKFIAFEQVVLQSTTKNYLVSSWQSDQACSVMYTSGTTGTPKGVVQTFGNHLASATNSAYNLGVLADDVWLCVVPIFHISGFAIMLRGLIYGCGVRLVAKFNAATVETILVREPISLISAVPYMLTQLLIHHKTDYNANFRAVLLGGGTIDAAQIKACFAANIAVVQCYGMTETCSQVVALSFADALSQVGSVGKPLLLNQVKIADDGEILIKSPALAPTYLHRFKLMAQKCRDGWFHTGDIGHFNAAGFLFVDGRSDEMIISGGENFFPQPLEAKLSTHPNVKEVAIVGVYDKLWEQIAVAFVVAKKACLPEELSTWLADKVPHYQRPKAYVFVAALPKTASGKVKRNQLRKMYQNFSDDKE